MEKEIVKRAYDEAQNSLREKQVEEVKKIVLETLRKIKYLEEDKKEKQSELKDLEERIKILRSDIDDLKEGRVDRIVERQEKDPKAKQVSVVVIIKEKEIIKEPWYQPYVIEKWNMPTYPQTPITYCQTTTTPWNYTDTCGNSWVGTITCSSSKYGTVGTYNVDGKIVNLR